MLLHLLGDAVGRRQDVVIVDEGAAAELSLQVHQSSLHSTRQPIEVDKHLAAGAYADWVKCTRKRGIYLQYKQQAYSLGGCVNLTMKGYSWRLASCPLTMYGRAGAE